MALVPAPNLTIEQLKALGPAAPSQSWCRMWPLWDMAETLMQGTLAMRDAGERYLPKHPAESNDAYRERLNCVTLTNILQIIADAWVGKPFSEELNISEDVPEKISELFPDIDLQGNSLQVFLRKTFREGLLKGIGGVLVDYPRKKEREDGQPRTLEDDLNENLRPYAVQLKPENIIFVSAEIVDGKEFLTSVRIFEQVITVDGWIEEVQNQVRVLTPGHCQIYHELWDKLKRKFVYKLVDEWDYDLPFIPVKIFYAEREGLMLSKPPLSDISFLNVRHYQSTSDQIAILTVTRFPMLGASGLVSDDSIIIGPQNILYTSDSQGRFYYIQHDAKAINTGRQDILDIENLAASYGAVFLQKRPGGASATQAALDTAAVTSPLEDIALRFNDFVKQVIEVFGAWFDLGPDEVGIVSVNTDFDFSDDDMAALQTLVSAREQKDLSRKYFLQALDEQGILPESFDPVENDKDLLTEQAADFAQQSKMMTLQAKLKPKPQPKQAPQQPQQSSSSSQEGDKPDDVEGE